MTDFKKGDRAKRVGPHILAGHPTQEFNDESRKGDIGTITYQSQYSENTHIRWDRTGRQSAIDPASLVPMRDLKVGDLWAWDGGEGDPTEYDGTTLRITDVTPGMVYYEYPGWAEPRTEFDRYVGDFLERAHYVSSPDPEPTFAVGQKAKVTGSTKVRHHYRPGTIVTLTAEPTGDPKFGGSEPYGEAWNTKAEPKENHTYGQYTYGQYIHPDDLEPYTEPEFKTGDTVEALRDTESEFGAKFPLGTQGKVNRPLNTPRTPGGHVATFRDKPGLVVDGTPQGDGFIVNPDDWAIVTPTVPEPPTPEFQAGDKVIVTANTKPYHYLEFGSATVVEPEYPHALGALRVEGKDRLSGKAIRNWVSPLDLTPADPAPAKAARPEFRAGQVWTYGALDVQITEVTDAVVKYQYVDGSGTTYRKPHDSFDLMTRGRLVEDVPQDTLPTRPGSAVLAGGAGANEGKHVVPLFLTTKGEWVTKYGANFGWSNALIKERGFTVLHDQDTVKEG